MFSFNEVFVIIAPGDKVIVTSFQESNFKRSGLELDKWSTRQIVGAKLGYINDHLNHDLAEKINRELYCYDWPHRIYYKEIEALKVKKGEAMVPVKNNLQKLKIDLTKAAFILEAHETSLPKKRIEHTPSQIKKTSKLISTFNKLKADSESTTISLLADLERIKDLHNLAVEKLITNKEKIHLAKVQAALPEIDCYFIKKENIPSLKTRFDRSAWKVCENKVVIDKDLQKKSIREFRDAKLANLDLPEMVYTQSKYLDEAPIVDAKAILRDLPNKIDTQSGSPEEVQKLVISKLEQVEKKLINIKVLNKSIA